jgi:DNA-binding SARP family transcriptional activator
MIQLRTLGTLALRNTAGEDLHSVLAQPKRVALLVNLAIARPRGFHRRDTLLALLWPEQDEQHARWALNQALRHLRSALGKEVLPSRGDEEVGVDFQALTCDAVEFEAAIDADDPARALELYQGDLLEGFHLSGCGEFERWLEEERVWLRRRAARAATLLAGREEARGEHVAAGHWARRAFALVPDDESEARKLIELLGRLGDRAGAVEAYESFARRLRGEYEVEPAPETRALIAAVRTRQAGRETSPTWGVAEPSGNGDESSAARPFVSLRELAPRRRRPAIFAALGLLLLVTAGAVVWRLKPSPPASRVTETSATVAVFPFAYRGASEFAYLGEGMMDLLSANLNGAGEIRTVEPRAVLALMRHAGDQSAEPQQAREIGARLGAGSYVLGDLVEAGGRLHITARLYAPRQVGGPVLASVQGTPSQLFQLMDGLTAKLIAGRSGGPGANLIRLAALTTDSLAALKAYLEAERHFRAGRLDSTMQALDRAIRIDSSFALAHYRMATAAPWASNQGGRSRGAVEQALRHGHRLSDHDRRLIEAFAASLQGRIAEAERTYREIVTQHPDDIEAAYQLGDLIFHRRSLLGRSWLDARELFEQVLSIDPGHIGALEHLSSIAARERELGELDSLTNRVLQIARPPAWFTRGQRAVAFGDTAELTRFVTAIRKASDDVAQPTAGAVAFTTGDLAVGRDLWRVIAEPSRSRGMRVLAHLTLAKMEVMTGRWTAAKAELEAAKALDPATALEHRALLSLWPLLNVPPSELRALRRTLLEWKAVPGPATEESVTGAHGPAHPYFRLYLLGLLSTRLGEHDDALAFAAELVRRAEASFAPSLVGDLGRTVRAEVARTRGQPHEALTTLDSTTGSWTREGLIRTGMSLFYDPEYQRFMKAELLHMLGRYGEALQAYKTLADDLFHSGAPAHLRMAQIYEQGVDQQKAIEHYERFVELWKDCDPELRPVLDEAQRRISD